MWIKRTYFITILSSFYMKDVPSVLECTLRVCYLSSSFPLCHADQMGRPLVATGSHTTPWFPLGQLWISLSQSLNPAIPRAPKHPVEIADPVQTATWQNHITVVMRGAFKHVSMQKTRGWPTCSKSLRVWDCSGGGFSVSSLEKSAKQNYRDSNFTALWLTSVIGKSDTVEVSGISS